MTDTWREAWNVAASRANDLERERDELREKLRLAQDDYAKYFAKARVYGAIACKYSATLQQIRDGGGTRDGTRSTASEALEWRVSESCGVPLAAFEHIGRLLVSSEAAENLREKLRDLENSTVDQLATLTQERNDTRRVLEDGGWIAAGDTLDTTVARLLCNRDECRRQADDLRSQCNAVVADRDDLREKLRAAEAELANERDNCLCVCCQAGGGPSRIAKLEAVADVARLFRKADTGGGFNDRVACGQALDATIAALDSTREPAAEPAATAPTDEAHAPTVAAALEAVALSLFRAGFPLQAGEMRNRAAEWRAKGGSR
jgi:hypothetical protein